MASLQFTEDTNPSNHFHKTVYYGLLSRKILPTYNSCSSVETSYDR